MRPILNQTKKKIPVEVLVFDCPCIFIHMQGRKTIYEQLSYSYKFYMQSKSSRT